MLYICGETYVETMSGATSGLGCGPRGLNNSAVTSLRLSSVFVLYSKQPLPGGNYYKIAFGSPLPI